jgi:hypothetical protein
MLRRQYEAIGALPEALKRALEVIIIDDGSPIDQMAFPPDRALGVDLKIFRHLVDVRWNQDACQTWEWKKIELDFATGHGSPGNGQRPLAHYVWPSSA